MIGYITLGVQDMERAEAFYTELLAELGAKKMMDAGRIKFFGTSPTRPMLAICIPYDEEPQHCGNGNMVAIPGGDKDNIKRLYDRALELGATDEGEPGVRVPDVFYGAYVRDPEGNKLCFFDMNMG